MKTLTRRFARLPKVGDKVTPVGKGCRPEYPAGTVGRVVDILEGCCGPIVAIQFPSYPRVTVDLFWKKVAIVK
jgi:hypothetical protein